jgi:hypothetical protein
MTEPTTDTPATEFSFKIQGTEATMVIDLNAIPIDWKRKAVENMAKTAITNRVNQAQVKFNKANEPFAKYDAALAAFTADPVTNANPGEAPTGERPTSPDLIAIASKAKADLLAGKLGERQKGDKPARKTVDPVEAAITTTVVRAVYDARRANNPQLKYPEVLAEVNKAGGGRAYLLAQIEAKVAAAPEAEKAEVRKASEKRLQDQYVGPAEVMAGRTTPKSLKDTAGLI